MIAYSEYSRTWFQIPLLLAYFFFHLSVISIRFLLFVIQCTLRGSASVDANLRACRQPAGSRVRSLFGEPLQFTLGIPRKNSSYLHTKKRPLWLQVSFFTRFNQPVTINNIAAVTLLKKKKNSSHTRDTRTHKCPLRQCLFVFGNKRRIRESHKKKKKGGE